MGIICSKDDADDHSATTKSPPNYSTLRAASQTNPAVVGRISTSSSATTLVDKTKNMLLIKAQAAPTKGETKSPTISSKEVAVLSPPVTILKDVFQCPDHIPEDMLTEAAKICQEAKERNMYNHHKGGEASRPDCNHGRVQGWKRDQCADCGADLGAARLAEEDRLAKNAEEEDAKAA